VSEWVISKIRYNCSARCYWPFAFADPRTRCDHPYKFKCILASTTAYNFSPTIYQWTRKPPRRLPSTASTLPALVRRRGSSSWYRILRVCRLQSKYRSRMPIRQKWCGLARPPNSARSYLQQQHSYRLHQCPTSDCRSRPCSGDRRRALDARLRVSSIAIHPTLSLQYIRAVSHGYSICQAVRAEGQSRTEGDDQDEEDKAVEPETTVALLFG